MRRLILAMMIVLLPLRGWMGDVMAMEVVNEAHVAIQSIAVNDHLTMDSASFDTKSDVLASGGGRGHCPGHALANASGSDGGPASAPGAGARDDSTGTDSDPAAQRSACTACQVCHTVAMSADAAPLPALPLPALAPELAFSRFTSTLPAPGLKPPIS